MHDVLFQVSLFGLLKDPWSIHCYGLLVAIGFLLAISLAWRHGRDEGEDPDRVVDLCYSILLAGLLGARLVFIATMARSYLDHPLEIFKIWRGGLVWYGGFLGAVGCAWWYCRRHRLGFFKSVDLLIAPMALAHSFGRLGCLTAGCCFGHPTDLPWGIRFPAGSLPQAAQLGEHLIRAGQRSLPVHPTQLYEAAAELALFFLLVAMRPFKRFHGQLFLTWLGLYPLLRSAIEMMRGDKERGVWGLLSTSQYISIAVGLAALALGLWFHRRLRDDDRGAVAAGAPG